MSLYGGCAHTLPAHIYVQKVNFASDVPFKVLLVCCGWLLGTTALPSGSKIFARVLYVLQQGIANTLLGCY